MSLKSPPLPVFSLHGVSLLRYISGSIPCCVPTLHPALVEEVAQLEVGVAGGEVLGEALDGNETMPLEDCTGKCFPFFPVHLVPVAHHVVNGDEALEDDDPVWVLRALQQQVGQGGDGHVGLLRAAEQVCKTSRWNDCLDSL